MPTYTSRLGLILPGAGENYDVEQTNENMRKLDTATDYTICTSTTRPSSPYAGQKILETDTKRTLYHDGTRWIFQNTPISAGTLTNGFTGSASWTRSGDVCTAQMYVTIGSGGPLAAWTGFTVATNFPKPRYDNIGGGYDTGVPILTNAFENIGFSVLITNSGALQIYARWTARSWGANTWMRAQWTYFTQNDDTA